ncbi:MAG: ABC transporter substrate-binding protein [Burkholderiaceae bacterium]
MNHEMRREVLRLLTLAGAAPIAAMPGLGMAAEDKPRRGGLAVLGTDQKPRHLNPAVQSGIATIMPGAQLFATPLRFDDKWNPQPYLAESWTFSDDGKSITLKLRRNAVFHDGRPITSEDLAFSVRTVQAHHPFKSMFAPVTGVDTPDAHTATIHLSDPHPALLLAMSTGLLPVIPKHVFDDGQDMKKHSMNSKPIGSGPFKLVEFKPGQHIIMERHDKFFLEGRPYLDRLIIRNFTDTASIMLALEKGEIDVHPYITNGVDIARMKRAPDVTVHANAAAALGPLIWVAFNLENPVLADKRVRHAIAHAIDKPTIVANVFQNGPDVATGPISLHSPLYSADVPGFAYDIDKAKALLTEAGYKTDGSDERLNFRIDWIPSAVYKALAEYVRPELAKIGITLALRNAPDFPTWARRISSYDFDLCIDSAWNWGDPVIGVHRTYLSSNIRKGVIWSNTQQYRNDKADMLMEAAGKEMDPARRKALYAQFQALIVDDMPVLPVMETNVHLAARPRIGNPPLSIWGPNGPMDEMFVKDA